MPESPEALPETEERLRANTPIITNGSLIQDDQKVSVHLKITYLLHGAESFLRS